ncbi:hypothetical protein ABBQ38_006938 [Trebouxia sp. C0009 RCD-2024]
MENSRTLLDFTRQPGLKYLRNEHVRLDVRVTLSVAARSALVDAVVVHQESQVAAAFVRLPENCGFSKSSCSLAFTDKALILRYREVSDEDVQVSREENHEMLLSLGTGLLVSCIVYLLSDKCSLICVWLLM